MGATSGPHTHHDRCPGEEPGGDGDGRQEQREEAVVGDFEKHSGAADAERCPGEGAKERVGVGKQRREDGEGEVEEERQPEPDHRPEKER